MFSLGSLGCKPPVGPWRLKQMDHHHWYIFQLHLTRSLVLFGTPAESHYGHVEMHDKLTLTYILTYTQLMFRDPCGFH